MDIPKYLVDALYQFSLDSVAEQEHLVELQKQADLADAIKAKKIS